MATAATQTSPYPYETKCGSLDVVILNGTMPADASGGLYWTIDWAEVLHVNPVCNATVATSDVGSFGWVYSAGVLTVYGANNAEENDSAVTVMVFGHR